ncbi:hypothetical protein [Streptosporangium amethystogenes]|uniref:hypothetical protein n=1 Tax=Streptosporangium amethystogenes TaxID=2002 RepID=UPI0004CB3221|nr:hypothetical protein [Streptosporangium amethystogenes]
MRVRFIVATFAVVMVAVAGTQPARARTPGIPGMSTTGSIGPGPWVKLAGTSGKLHDIAKAPVRLASYSLTFDAGQGHHGYLREGDRFVKTPYREALVSPGERWVAGIPDYRLWIATERIDLIDRRSGRRHTISMPAPVTSPEWSSDGRTLLLTAYRTHPDDSLTIIGFITMNVADRIPHLVRTGPRHRVADWDIGRKFRFYFAGDASRVLAVRDDLDVAPSRRRIVVYGLDGRQRRVYTGIGILDEWHAVTPFSPSGRLFATFEKRTGNSGQVSIVEASSGKIVHRIGHRPSVFAGWYDDRHVILMRKRGKTQTYQRVDLSGAVEVDLIEEKLIPGPAEYKPYLSRVDFVRRR